jgi:ATP-dependent Clp protease ATP-binding subunit ClpB
MSTILNESASLERYGHNLTELAKRGAFSPLIGQDAVVKRMFQVLLRENKCNPVLLGSHEAGRWAVLTEVIRRMAIGDAPDPLPNKQVMALDYEALLSDLPKDIFRPRVIRSYSFEALIHAKPGSEEWAFLEQLRHRLSLEERDTPMKRLQSLFTAMHQTAGSFLLFVDHFHRIVGGEWDRYPIDAAPLLKPLLARRQIQLMGACNLEQYRQHIERDGAIQRRCQEICLPEVYDNF